jgi:hypothetical protein
LTKHFPVAFPATSFIQFSVASRNYEEACRQIKSNEKGSGGRGRGGAHDFTDSGPEEQANQGSGLACVAIADSFTTPLFLPVFALPVAYLASVCLSVESAGVCLQEGAHCACHASSVTRRSSLAHQARSLQMSAIVHRKVSAVQVFYHVSSSDFCNV